jgi:hypothetical protein
VAEWLMAPVLKTGVPERVSGVRIPPLPPFRRQHCSISADTGRKQLKFPKASLIQAPCLLENFVLGRSPTGDLQFSRFSDSG